MGDATVKRVSTIFTLKDDEFNRSLTNINKQMKLTQSELKLAGASLKNFGNDTRALAEKQKALERQMTNIKDKVKVYNESIKKNTESYKQNKAELEQLSKKKDALNKKYKEAVKAYGEESAETKKLKTELDQTTQSYKKKESQLKQNVNALNKSTTEINKAETELVNLQAELDRTNDAIKKNSSNYLKLGENLEKAGNKIQNAGAKLSEVGGGLIKLGTPLVTVGGLAAKMSIDFEKGLAKVSTLIDTSVVDIDTFKKAIVDLSNETGIGVNELSESLYQALSAGVSTTDAMKFLGESTKLAKSGFADTTQTIDLLTTILNSYGLEASEVNRISDILVQTQNKGKTTINELASSMGKVIPTAKSNGVAIEQLGSAYALMTSKGIATAESTTYLNSMFNELGKSGTKASDALKKASGKGFKELMESGASLGDVLAILVKHSDKTGLSLADMFGSAEAGKAALVLATEGGSEFNKMLEEMGNSAGSTEEAFKKVSDTTGEKLTKSINKFKNSFLKLGDSLAPTIDILADGMGKVTDAISKMDAEQLAAIVKFGAMSVVMGTTLKSVGGLVSGFGGLVKGAGKVAKTLGLVSTATATTGTAAAVAGGASGMGALVGSLGGILSTALPVVGAVGGIALAGYGLYKCLNKEVVPSVDVFADKLEVTGQKVDEFGNIIYETTTTKISDATKEAVGSYLEMDKGVTEALGSLYVNSTTITDENCNTLVTKYQEMGDKISTGLEEDKNKDLETLTNFFANSAAISEEEEAFILENTNTMYAEKQRITQEKVDTIKGILETAKNENRALTDEERVQINQIQQEMKTEAINTLSNQEVEAKTILERMKANDERITAEQCATHIAELNRSRDESVRVANEEYDKRIATIIKMRDESKVISAEQADKLIQEATRQRDGIVEKAEDTRINAIEKMRQMNNELDNQIDTSTGQILSTWDKLKRWWSSWKPETKQFKATVHTTHTQPSDPMGGYSPMYATGSNYVPNNGIATVAENGWELFDNTSKSFAIDTRQAYLERGTKVTNHLASTNMMLREIDRAVEQKLNRALDKTSSGSEGNNITFNSTYHVTAKSDFDVEIFEKKVIKNMTNKFEQGGLNKIINNSAKKIGYSTLIK